jgi:hypothetical protein
MVIHKTQMKEIGTGVQDTRNIYEQCVDKKKTN